MARKGDFIYAFSHQVMMACLRVFPPWPRRRLSAKDLARELPCSVGQINSWRRQGIITGIRKPGKKWAYDYEQVVLELRLWAKEMERGE